MSDQEEEKRKLELIKRANPELGGLLDGIDMSEKKIFVQGPDQDITEFLKEKGEL